MYSNGRLSVQHVSIHTSKPIWWKKINVIILKFQTLHQKADYILSQTFLNFNMHYRLILIASFTLSAGSKTFEVNFKSYLVYLIEHLLITLSTVPKSEAFYTCLLFVCYYRDWGDDRT